MRGTVLVIDDDAEIRNTIADILGGEGYGIAEAENGREALAQLRAGLRPSLILLDLMMPIMDGWEFLEERAKDEVLKALSVVVVSATPEIVRVPETSGFVRKPMRLERLLEAVERGCS